MIGFIVAGLIIGLLARLLLPGRQRIGLVWTLVIGVIGSVIGGTVANAIGSGDIFELNVLGFVMAVVVSVVVLAVAESAGLGSGPDRKKLDKRH
ncbi:MAG: GlsB/YeaQ/YmgE family stress response membrane protein [Solirubrobacterales bacterium]|nr:GlsB/YeaQ/YmgE family stress response membrane protein [Solirubrobacterales bacterium]